MSKVPPVGAWMCLEFMIDQAQGLISTWVDGNQVAGLVADATPTPDVDSAWGTAYKPSLTGFNVGWQNYGAGPMNSVVRRCRAVCDTHWLQLIDHF